MRLKAQYVGLDQRRPGACPGAIRRLQDEGVDLEEIVTRHSNAGDAIGQRRGKVPVVKTKAVSTGLQRGDRRDLGYLVATWRDDEGEFAGAVQNETSVVERPGPQYCAVGIEDAFLGQVRSIAWQPT